jgi:hypothetical protein
MKVPLENSWRNVPPSFSSSESKPKNTPSSIRPNLRSVFSPEPPTTGRMWQVPQPFSLNVGPSPSTIVSASANASSASSNASGSVPGRVSPISPVTPCCAIPSSPPSSIAAHASPPVTSMAVHEYVTNNLDVRPMAIPPLCEVRLCRRRWVFLRQPSPDPGRADALARPERLAGISTTSPLPAAPIARLGADVKMEIGGRHRRRESPETRPLQFCRGRRCCVETSRDRLDRANAASISRGRSR